MNNMKLIMENWNRHLEEDGSSLSEKDLQEIQEVYEDLVISMIQEGIIAAGSSLWNATKEKIKQLKDWGQEKLQSLVKKMGNGLINFFKGLRQKGVWKKYQTRKLVNAVRLLLTKKHIPIATMIFTGIMKLTGGLAISAVMNSVEILESLTEAFEKILGGDIKAALEILFGAGDAAEAIKLAGKLADFRKDSQSLAGLTGDVEAFGGLAEVLPQ